MVCEGIDDFIGAAVAGKFEHEMGILFAISRRWGRSFDGPLKARDAK